MGKQRVAFSLSALKWGQNLGQLLPVSQSSFRAQTSQIITSQALTSDSRWRKMRRRRGRRRDKQKYRHVRERPNELWIELQPRQDGKRTSKGGHPVD